MKRLVPLLFILAACGSGEKTPFCKCMEAGNELNEYSSKILEKSEIDSKAESKMKELKATKKKLCKEYEMMSGAEMLELKRACTEMNAQEADVQRQDSEMENESQN